MTEQTRTFLQILSDMLATFAVYGVMILLLLTLMANWSLPYFSVMKPQLFLIAVFYWTLYRPRFLPAPMIFVAGLLLDLMTPAVPMGTHAFSYLLIAGLMRPRRRMIMGQPFIAVWIWFALAAFIDLVVKVLIIGALSPTPIQIWTLALAAFVTVLSFPLLLMVFVLLQRLLPATRSLVPA